MSIFIWFMIIGVAVLLLSLLVDDVFDIDFIDGFIPALGITSVVFGIFGYVTENLAFVGTVGYFIVSVVLSLGTFVGSVFAWRSIKAHIPTSSEDMLVSEITGLEATVVWWSGGTGEITVVADGSVSTFMASSSDDFVSGETARVSNSDSFDAVRIVKV